MAVTLNCIPLDIERVRMEDPENCISTPLLRCARYLLIGIADSSPLSIDAETRAHLANYALKIWEIKLNGESRSQIDCLLSDEPVQIDIHWDIVNLSSGRTPGINWSDAQKTLVDSVKAVSEEYFQSVFAGKNLMAICKLSDLSNITTCPENPSVTQFVSQMRFFPLEPGVYKFRMLQVCSRISDIIQSSWVADFVAARIPSPHISEIEEYDDGMNPVDAVPPDLENDEVQSTNSSSSEGENASPVLIGEAVGGAEEPLQMLCENSIFYGIHMGVYKAEEGEEDPDVPVDFTITVPAAPPLMPSLADIAAGGASSW